MTIVFVIDNYKALSNGTNVTANRFADKLRKLGHEVRIVTNNYEGENVFSLKTRFIPIVSRVAKKQDVEFSKPDKMILQKAFEGADVIHFFTPWKTSRVALKIAKKMKIPVVGAFHVPPESIVFGGKLKFIGWFLTGYLYRRFRRFFKKIKHVHCPSFLTANRLKKYQYPNQFHVISNGIDEAFYYVKKEKGNEKFNIISIGRLAPEKNQKLLIKAISKSAFKDKINLTILGKGPDERYLKRLARRLKVDVTFDFLNKEELIKTLHHQDLYVHTSVIEIEGLSCLEAVACGKVPLVADSKDSATTQFALDERSIFKSNDVNDLKNKIDYWINNQDEIKKMEPQYANLANKYRIDESISRYLDMLRNAIYDFKNAMLIKTKEGKKIKKEIVGGKIRKVITKPFYYSAVPLLMVFNKAYLKAKIRNKRNLKKVKGGAVIISNHVHMLDSVMSGFVAFPRQVTFTGLKTNFDLPYAGKLVKAFGTVAIPETLTENKIFFHELSKKVRKGQLVHFFPEGELVEGDEVIRDFKKGAFKLAVESSAPIIPIRINFVDRRKRRPVKRKRMVVNVGKPIYPDYMNHPKDAVMDLKRQVEEAMQFLS